MFKDSKKESYREFIYLYQLLKHINTMLVPAAGKIGGHPGADNFRSKAGTGHPGTQAEYVCIIVLATHPGRKHLTTERRPDLRVPVGSH